MDGFLHPPLPVINELIEKVEPLKEMKLDSFYLGDRLFMLSYKYINEAHEIFKCKKFLGVVNVLSEINKHSFVHGDNRRENMVFPEDGESCLIDFDFVGKDSEDNYLENYNCTLLEKHIDAIADLPVKFIHDRYS